MGAFTALFSPLGHFLRDRPYISILVCAVAAVLSEMLHSGNFIALFTCMGSGLLMWKNEMDHPSTVVTAADATAA
jgi:hypothetical protein